MTEEPSGSGVAVRNLQDAASRVAAAKEAKGATKDVCLFAYHFPPIQGSSGVHRTLAFAKFLPSNGWRATIFTVNERAYPRVARRNTEMVPPDLNVVRTFALDTQRHLAVLGRYPALLALPDRWQSWIPMGILAGLRFIRRKRPRAVMSTFPIASAHVIARALHRRTGIPWIADLRDPMVFESFPPPGPTRRAYERLEESVFREAGAVIVTTKGAADEYRRRYPEAANKLRVIENGVDEEIFEGVPPPGARPTAGGPMRLVHSGLVYPEARNPRPFLAALERLKTEGVVSSADLEVVFRASGCEEFLQAEASKRNLEGIVRILPPIDYQSAVAEMCASDGLVLLQAKSCNSQIPAKAYEYLYCERPILALTDPAGNTGELLRSFGVETICALESQDSTYTLLKDFIARLRRGRIAVLRRSQLGSILRRARARELAATLDEIA